MTYFLKKVINNYWEMVEKVGNTDTISLFLSENDGIETEIKISKNAKV